MTLSELIQGLSQELLPEVDLKQAADELGLSVIGLCDAFAREVGQGYLQGRYTWEFGNAAMNNMFTAAYVVGDFGLSEFAWSNFAAFDEGEYVHLGEPAEHEGEPRTKSMLAAVFARNA